MKTISKEFWEDLRWGEQHHGEFLESYRDQWIAVANKKVVASGNNLHKVKEEAKKKTGKSEVPLLFVDCGEHIYVQD